MKMLNFAKQTLKSCFKYMFLKHVKISNRSRQQYEFKPSSPNNPPPQKNVLIDKSYLSIV